MNEVTKRKAEYLFDELGLIDEAIIADAENYARRSERRAPSLEKLSAIAATAAVITTLALGAVVVGNLGGLTMQKGEDNVENTNNEYVALVDLSASLIRAEESGRTHSYASAEDIELFDGVTKIIWKSFVSENYYAIELNSISENNALYSALQNTYASDTSASSEYAESYKVWVSYGDGSVVSPYLRESAGNVGYGEIFDYSPEILPSEKLGEFIDDLIE